jgi:hypothetical protein
MLNVPVQVLRAGVYRKLAARRSLRAPSPATDPESAGLLDVLARFRCVRDYTHDVPSILRYFSLQRYVSPRERNFVFFSSLFFFLVGDVGQAKVVEPGWSKLSL